MKRSIRNFLIAFCLLFSSAVYAMIIVPQAGRPPMIVPTAPAKTTSLTKEQQDYKSNIEVDKCQLWKMCYRDNCIYTIDRNIYRSINSCLNSYGGNACIEKYRGVSFYTGKCL